MLYDFVMDRIWLAVGLWVVLYTSDYMLTIAGARMYASGVTRHFEYPGGYELNPAFASEVASLQWISFKFFIVLALYGGLLLAFSTGGKDLFAFGWGFVVLPQLYIHIRHIRNLVFLRQVRRSKGVDGKVRIAHWLSLRTMAAEWFALSAFLLFLHLITASLPTLGGVVSAAAYGVGALRNASKHRKLADSVQQQAVMNPTLVHYPAPKPSSERAGI